MRLRLEIAYVGSRYAGWQVQPGQATVQGELEKAVERVGGRTTRVTGASRTDAGVHAAGQVAHLDAPRDLQPDVWQRALNSCLPADIRVVGCRRAAAGFHARFDARGKTYRYALDPAPVASPFLAPFAWHCPRLDRDLLTRAAALLPGPIDQSLFGRRPDDDARTLRPVDSCTVAGDRPVTVDVVGRSFLRHAVRGMVGMLVRVARGQMGLDGLEAMVRRRPEHPPMTLRAPAHGLCLVRVTYPDDPGSDDGDSAASGPDASVLSQSLLESRGGPRRRTALSGAWL